MSADRKLFGTDGVRGVANVEPVTAETALKLGRAAAHIFRTLANGGTTETRLRIVVGKDTRLSGYMLENAIIAGITSLGADALIIGPLPTPGVAYITRSLRADAGIVLSASHNPYEDNGIKFFRHDGYKLDDAIEKQIEHLVFSGEIDNIRPTATQIGKAFRVDDALGRYIEFVKSSVPRRLTLESLHIAVDCANGAAYKSTPYVLQELGARLSVFHNTPDGTNINAECGSTHPERICQYVRQEGANVGLTHDGDADRVLLADENGELVDGDEIMAIAALDFIRRDCLAGKTLVTTIMSNCGLEEALEAAGGRVVRTKVGDRYVIEEMMRNDLNVGGEQSGHMIFRDYSTTGDGLVSALQILRIMEETGKPLSELKKCLSKYPQVQRNLRIREKPPLESLTKVQSLLAEAEKSLQGRGRLLLRYSGTEPKIRLLIEGREQSLIETHADRIAEALAEAIGA